MPFVTDTLQKPRPNSLAGLQLPRREAVILRQSTGATRCSTSSWSTASATAGRHASAARPQQPRGGPAGRTQRIRMALGPLGAVRAQRWQGGTITGVTSKLEYLQRPRRDHDLARPRLQAARPLDTYHGYGVQDFLDVDPRFGTRDDLVELVGEAHSRGLRVILDIIFNHSGINWLYPQGTPGGEHKAHYTARPLPLRRLARRGRRGAAGVASAAEDGVWPAELQDLDALHAGRLRQPRRGRSARCQRRAQAQRLRGPA